MSCELHITCNATRPTQVPEPFELQGVTAELGNEETTPEDLETSLEEVINEYCTPMFLQIAERRRGNAWSDGVAETWQLAKYLIDR